MEIYFTKQSKEDIKQFLRYIAKKDLKAVVKLSNKIEHTCNLLEVMPEIGSVVESVVETEGLSRTKVSEMGEIINNMRRFSVVDFKKFIIFYRIKSKRVVIVRILHSSRDISMIFNNLEK